jgi:hypothetical protein
MIGLAAAVLVAATGGNWAVPVYDGPHFTKRAEAFLTCAALRESGGNWTSDGPYGSGAWQIIQPTWDFYAAAAGFPQWVGKRAAKAPPSVQTAVAYVIVNPLPQKPGLEGKHHWHPRHALTVGAVVRSCEGAR